MLSLGMFLFYHNERSTNMDYLPNRPMNEFMFFMGDVQRIKIKESSAGIAELSSFIWRNELYQERFGDDNQQDEQNQNGTYRSETSVSVASCFST